MSIKGIVFDIQRYSIHDGPGIRTNIFLKGCPLRCQWCHNPEGLSSKKEISYLEKKCVNCGACVAACPMDCHNITLEGIHVFNRAACIACGECTQACMFLALEQIGREMTAQEVIDEALADQEFFSSSSGGITLSGGEPLYQPEFAAEILRIAKEKNVTTCLETSGFASESTIKKIIPFVDLFLFDIKETSSQRHIEFTGVPNEPILNNLRFISQSGGKIVLRCPIIPQVNDRIEHAVAIADLANELKGVIRIELEPYHPLGLKKRERFGIAAEYTRDTFLKKDELEPFRTKMQNITAVPIEIK